MQETVLPDNVLREAGQAWAAPAFIQSHFYKDAGVVEDWMEKWRLAGVIKNMRDDEGRPIIMLYDEANMPCYEH